MKYFMRSTPLRRAEQEMMTPPHDKKRGGGMANTFRYTAENTDCQYCLKYDRRKPCSLSDCEWLEERIKAGVIGLNDLARLTFCKEEPLELGKRLNETSLTCFRDEAHRVRWNKQKRSYCYMSDKNKAAVFLLTSNGDLWKRMCWKCSGGDFAYDEVCLCGVTEEQYTVYQAARTISAGADKITMNDLASPDIVPDEAFCLIICAMLLARYGEVILQCG